MKNKKVTISLEPLFNRLTGYDTEEEYVSTEYGNIEKEIEDDSEYFDFRNNSLPYMGIACMDGETCEILEETEQYVLLQEEDMKIPFKLSKEEFDIAALIKS